MSAEGYWSESLSNADLIRLGITPFEVFAMHDYGLAESAETEGKDIGCFRLAVRDLSASSIAELKATLETTRRLRNGGGQFEVVRFTNDSSVEFKVSK